MQNIEGSNTETNHIQPSKNKKITKSRIKKKITMEIRKDKKITTKIYQKFIKNNKKNSKIFSKKSKVIENRMIKRVGALAGGCSYWV